MYGNRYINNTTDTALPNDNDSSNGKIHCKNIQRDNDTSNNNNK